MKRSARINVPPEPEAAQPQPAPPSISVIIPVYNHASYIAEALHSVWESTRYPTEVILVNDGSTDGLAAALEPFKNEKRLQILDQKNRGLSHALNAGFARASGRFVTWTSADNGYAPGALDRLADFLIAHPTVGMTYGNVQLIDEAGNPALDSNYRRNDQSPDNSSVLSLPRMADTLGSFNDNFINACFLLRRSVLALVGGHSQELNGFEDYDFWLRLSAVAPIEHIGVDKPLYSYRLHENSLTHTLRMDEIRLQQVRSLTAAAKASAYLKNPDARISSTSLSDTELQLLSKQLGIPSEESVAVSRGDKLLEISSKELARSVLLRPAFAENISFRHGGLSRYQFSSLKTIFFAEPGPQTALEFLPMAELLPPIRLPQMLRRARDSSLGAVTKAEKSYASLLYFCPDDQEQSAWEFKQLVGLISRSPIYTWVLFARTKTQRKFADQVNSALSDNTYLRIIDISEEPNTDWEPVQEEHFSDSPWQERSLLYALSSVEGVISLKSDLAQISQLLELRQELALAAAAGLPLIAGHEKFAKSALSELAFDAPHLSLVELDRELTFSQPPPRVSFTALDEWLERQSISAFRSAILTLLQAKSVPA